MDGHESSSFWRYPDSLTPQNHNHWMERFFHNTVQSEASQCNSGTATTAAIKKRRRQLIVAEHLVTTAVRMALNCLSRLFEREHRL
ncbi:hypothetical protein Q1695_006426 [Nippostrongylus brasiliensis]|nr:hypothetical protein Q1695_006426 [Nippostrongylus brasiliensis]